MEIFGLPLHPLTVHAVVVLVPLAAVGGLAISVLKAVRIRYGWLVCAFALAAWVSTLVAQLAGQDFSESFPRPTPNMERHFDLGNDVLVWVIMLFVGTVAVMIGQLLLQRADARGRLALLIGMVVTIGSAVGSMIQVARVGLSGTTAVWGG